MTSLRLIFNISHKQILHTMFPPANKQSWLQQVTKDLKGAAIEPVIQWEFEKGLQAEALLFPDEATIYAYQQVLAVQNPNIAIQTWRNRMEIILSEEKIANKIALEALNQGIEEIAFVLDSKQTETVDFGLLLQNILSVSYTHLTLPTKRIV